MDINLFLHTQAQEQKQSLKRNILHFCYLLFTTHPATAPQHDFFSLLMCMIQDDAVINESFERDLFLMFST